MHFGSPLDPSHTAAAKAKPRYVHSILKPHGQSSKSPVRLLPCKAKLSYVYTIFKNITSPGLVPSSCVRLGCTRAAGTSQSIQKIDLYWQQKAKNSLPQPVATHKPSWELICLYPIGFFTVFYFIKLIVHPSELTCVLHGSKWSGDNPATLETNMTFEDYSL